MPNLLLDRRPEVAPPPTLGSSRGHRGGRRLRLAGTGTALAVLVAAVVQWGGLLPSWDNPFEQRTIDRSTPPLLLALEDLEQYHAATGTFQVVIDREKDTRYVPSVISGERVSFLATGTVDAYVDFSGLDRERVRMSADRRAVRISLPPAALGPARVDPKASRVLDRDRGVLERIGGAVSEDPSVEGDLYALGEKRLAAAADRSNLVRRAEGNTRQMLTTLATSLGFRQVTVTFDASASSD